MFYMLKNLVFIGVAGSVAARNYEFTQKSEESFSSVNGHHSASRIDMSLKKEGGESPRGQFSFVADDDGTKFKLSEDSGRNPEVFEGITSIGDLTRVAKEKIGALIKKYSTPAISDVAKESDKAPSGIPQSAAGLLERFSGTSLVSLTDKIFAGGQKEISNRFIACGGSPECFKKLLTDVSEGLLDVPEIAKGVKELDDCATNPDCNRKSVDREPELEEIPSEESVEGEPEMEDISSTTYIPDKLETELLDYAEKCKGDPDCIGAMLAEGEEDGFQSVREELAEGLRQAGVPEAEVEEFENEYSDPLVTSDEQLTQQLEDAAEVFEQLPEDVQDAVTDAINRIPEPEQEAIAEEFNACDGSPECIGKLEEKFLARLEGMPAISTPADKNLVSEEGRIAEIFGQFPMSDEEKLEAFQIIQECDGDWKCMEHSLEEIEAEEDNGQGGDDSLGYDEEGDEYDQEGDNSLLDDDQEELLDEGFEQITELCDENPECIERLFTAMGQVDQQHDSNELQASEGHKNNLRSYIAASGP